MCLTGLATPPPLHAKPLITLNNLQNFRNGAYASLHKWSAYQQNRCARPARAHKSLRISGPRQEDRGNQTTFRMVLQHQRAVVRVDDAAGDAQPQAKAAGVLGAAVIKPEVRL